MRQSQGAAAGARMYRRLFARAKSGHQVRYMRIKRAMKLAIAIVEIPGLPDLGALVFSIQPEGACGAGRPAAFPADARQEF